MPLDPVLKKFIDEAVAKGRTAKDIGSSIAEAGWGSAHISEAESYYNSKKKSSSYTSTSPRLGSFLDGETTNSSSVLSPDFTDLSSELRRRKKTSDEFGLQYRDPFSVKGAAFSAPVNQTGLPDDVLSMVTESQKEAGLYDQKPSQFYFEQGGQENAAMGMINAVDRYENAQRQIKRIEETTVFPDDVFERELRAIPSNGKKGKDQFHIRVDIGPEGYGYRMFPMTEEGKRRALFISGNEEKLAREKLLPQFKASYDIYKALAEAGKLGSDPVPEWEDFNGNPSKEAIDWVSRKTGDFQEQELQKFKQKAIKEAESTNVASRWAVNMLYGMIVASETIFSPLRQLDRGYKTVYKEGEFFPTFEETGYVDTDPDNIIGGGLFKKEKQALEDMDVAAVGEKLLKDYSIEEIQKGVFGNLGEGNYKAAFGLLGMDAIEMIPQLLSAAAFRDIGLLAMGTSAAGKAWTRVDDNPAYNVAEKAVYSIIAGAAEYYTEKIFRYDRDLLSGALRFSRQTGKKGLGDIMFGFLPATARAIVEEGVEEGIVDVITQGMEMAVEGKKFDGFQLADAVLLGGVMGGGSFVLAKSPNVLGRIPGMRNRLEMDSEIAQIYQVLSRSGLAIDSPERINLENRLRDLLAEQKSRADKDMLFYGQYSQEDKEETYALQQSVLANMEAFREAKTAIGRKAIVEQIKADMAKIETIESKYDSQEKQQISSKVTAGQELGGVQLDEAGTQATETGGILQESEQEKEQARQNADNLERSQPARNPDSFTDVDSQGAENIRNTLYDFIKNAANTFFTNQSSKRQAVRAAESITNIVKAINALGKKMNVSLFYTKESFKDYLINSVGMTEQEAAKTIDSRGLHISGKEGENNTIALFVPNLLANTTYHEGLHEVIPAVFGQKGINILFNGIRRSLLSNPLLNEYFKRFGAEYKKGDVGEEFVVELASLIADGSVSVKVKRGIIDTFMEQFAKLLGLVGIDVRPTQGQFLEMLADLSEKIGSGEDIGEISKAFNVEFSKEELEEMANGDIESVPFITTNIVAPTNVKRHSIVFPKSGTYPLSKVTKSDVKDIVAFLKEEVRRGKIFSFWYSDQFGRGTYVDPYTKKEYFLDGGPSFMVDPENKKNGDVWSAGGKALTLYNILIESPVGNEVSDYVVHISGHPTKMMQYNRVFNKIWVDRARQAFPDINDFKAELTSISKIEGIMSFIENMTSWDEMLSGIESGNLNTYKKIREAIGFIKESDIKISPPGKKGDLVGTRLYKFLDKYGLHPDNFDDARDGYYREYDFQEGEILNIYKPTEIVENAGIHATYPNGIKGEPILIPDARIFSFDIMSEEVRRRRKPKGKDSEGNIIYGDELQNLEKSAIQKAMAPDTPTRYSITKNEKQIEKAARKVKQMKIMTPMGSIPKLVENLDVLMTPATTKRVQYRVSEEKRFVIKDLSEKFDEAVKQGNVSDEVKYGKQLEELGQEILEGARKTIKNEVAKHRGVAVQFGDDYIGSWNKVFEPSLNMKLILTPESNEQAISDMISRFGERYNQDAVIIEKRSYKEEDYKNNLIDMPLTERDEGSNLDHYPQIFIEFEEKMTNEQVNALSLALDKSELIQSFSVNKNEIKISIIHPPFGEWKQKADESNEEYYKRKQENYEQQLREFQKIWNEVLGSNVNVRANIRIRQSYYYEGTEDKFKPKGYEPKDKNDEGYDIRRYSRDNFLKEFKTTLTSTEKKIAEYKKLREEEIILSEQKKKLPKDKQERLDEIRKEVQPVIESTFAYNKTFFYALRRKLNEIAESFASKVDGAFVSTFSIKRPSRAAVKALRWYFGATEELGDGARVNIIVENEDDANKIYELIQKEYPRKKNEERRVNESTELGYPKRLIEVSDIIDGFIAEIQVMTAEGYLAKDGVSWFNSEKRDEARASLRKVQERLGWKIPDGLGHYFYEIHRDPNIDSKIRDEALRLSNDYYRAFTNKNSTLNEGSFMSDVIDFKRMVDKADKSDWDEGNKAESPKTLDSYIRSRDGKKPIKRTKAQIISGKRFGSSRMSTRRLGKDGEYLELMSSWASESMKRAIALEDKGLNPEQIYYQTGWERGDDKVWRYELEPLKLKDSALNDLIVYDEILSVADLIKERHIDEPRTQDNETVLDYYPELQNITLLIGPYGQGTFYDPIDKIIQIDKNVVDAGTNEVYLAIVHEVQHAIQHIDNLNWGSSPEEAKIHLEAAIEGAEELRKTALIKSKELKEKLEDLYGETLDNLTKESSSELSNFDNYGSIARYNEYKTYVELVESSQKKLGRLKLTLRRLLDGEIDSDDVYMLFAGEAEARNAEKRALMSKEERKATPFSMSEDRLRDEQIVILPAGLEKPSAKVKRMAIESPETPSQIDAEARDLLLDLFKGTKYFDRFKSIKRQGIIDPESRDKYVKALKEKDGRALYNILGNQNAEKAIAFAREKFPIRGSLAAMANRVYLDDQWNTQNFGSTVIYNEYQKYIKGELGEIVNTSTADPKDLLREVGYELFNPKNLEEARGSFLHFYENGHNICTLNPGSERFKTSFVTFIVRDDAAITPMADKLTQDNLTPAWKEYLEKKGRKNDDGTYNLNGIGRDPLDPYSTSVVSLQINKSNGSVKEISRYNHQIGSPDNIFNKDFNKIIDGLEDAMFNKFGVDKNLKQSKVKLPYGIIQDAKGSFFNYVFERNGVYYGDGFYLEGGTTTILNKDSQRMVDGYVINANGKVENVTLGPVFPYGSVSKVNYFKGNEISLTTNNGDFVFEVKNGAVVKLIKFPKEWRDAELKSIVNYKYDTEGGIVIQMITSRELFLERMNMLWADDIVGFDRSIIFGGTKIQSLGKVKYILGLVSFQDSNVRSTGDLMFIGGNAIFESSQIESLGEIRYIGGKARFFNSAIKSLGKLRYLGSDLDLNSTKIESLGELRFVRGSGDFSYSEVNSFGKLKYIGESLDSGLVEFMGDLRYIGKSVSFGAIQDKTFGELRYVGEHIYLGNASRIQSIGNLGYVGIQKRYFGTTNNIKEEVNNIVGSIPSEAIGLELRTEYAKVSKAYSDLANKVEKLVQTYSDSSSLVEKAILEIDKIGDEDTEVKGQVKAQRVSKDIGKVKRMALGTTKGRLYAYLLGHSEKDVNGNVTMFVDRAEFIRVASSFMGAQEAADIYDNVANDNVPTDALDPQSYTGDIDKAYLDSMSKIERETNKAIFTIKNAIVKLLDRQHLIKAEVLKAGLQRAKNLIVNKAGASSRALAFVKSWESRIYKGLSQEENTLLDKIIVLRRISTIDANFAKRFDDALAEYNDAMAKLQNLQPNTPAYDKTLRKALNAQKKMAEAKPPTHPENIDGLTASLELSRLQAEMGDEAFTKLNERADEYFDAFSSILDEMYREGMISEKLYEQLAGLDYQPRVFLEHMFEDMDSNMMNEHRFTGPIIQRLKEGSDKEMLFNSRYLLRIYAKNAFTRIAKNKIHVELGKAADVPTNASWISKTAKTGFSEIVYYTQKGRKQGVQQKFYLRNDLYSSLNDIKRYGLLSPQAQNIIGIVTGARLLKMLATQLNPLFVVKNIPRDFTHILMFTDFYDNVPLPIAMFKLGMDYIRGAKSKITDDKWFKLYIKFGGGMEFLSTEGEESIGLGNPSSAQQRRMARLGMKASEVLTKGREYLGYLGELSEIAPRLGIFQSLVEKRLEEAGVDINSEAAKPIIEEAVTLVREIIDFSQGGELTKAGESAIPYLNAAFQGFRVSTSYIANNPKQFAFKLAQLSVAVFALALFNASLGDDDMEDISDEIKFRNWIILTPFKDKDGNRYYLKIAKTQQLQAFANLLEIGAETYVASQNNRDPRINDDISKIALKTVGSYLPKDISKLDKEIMTSVPVFAAMYTYNSNYDAFRDQIVSRDYAKQTSQGKPSAQYEDLFDKDVPYFYKAIGQGLGLGPKRLQASTEKVITSPHSSLIVMGSYSILDAFSRKYELEGPNGMKIQDVQDISKGVGERLGADAKKVFVGVTNPDTKSYRKRDEVDKANIETNDRRLFLKKEADKWGEKLYNLDRQNVSAETYNRYIDSIKAQVEKLDEKDAEFFKNRINAVAKKGPDIPQQYNELMFAADDVARAKILYIYDQNMTDQEIYNYMGDYTSAVGRNINREQNIRIAKEYAKIKRDEEK